MVCAIPEARVFVRDTAAEQSLWENGGIKTTAGWREKSTECVWEKGPLLIASFSASG